jgi:hypothetical protein
MIKFTLTKVLSLLGQALDTLNLESLGASTPARVATELLLPSCRLTVLRSDCWTYGLTPLSRIAACKIRHSSFLFPYVCVCVCVCVALPILGGAELRGA